MRFLTMLFGFLSIFVAIFLPQTAAFDSCTHNGVRYNHGDEWVFRRSFIMKCYADNYRWEAKVVACLSLMGDRIPLGGQIRDRHGVWKCVENADAVRMIQEPAETRQALLAKMGVQQK